MSESILVTGKRISDMELLANLSGSEKIPTGTANDNAVTPEMIKDYVIEKGDVVQKTELDSYKDDINSQIDSLGDVVSQNDQSIRALYEQERSERVSKDNQLTTSLSNLDEKINNSIVSLSDSIEQGDRSVREDLTSAIETGLDGKVDKVGSVSSVVSLTGDITSQQIYQALDLKTTATTEPDLLPVSNDQMRSFVHNIGNLQDIADRPLSEGDLVYIKDNSQIYKVTSDSLVPNGVTILGIGNELFLESLEVDYLTPEMFEVPVDGVTDATSALNNLFTSSKDLNLPVVFTKPLELVVSGEVRIYRPVEFNWSRFKAVRPSESAPTVTVRFCRRSDINSVTFDFVNVVIDPTQTEQQKQLSSEVTGCLFLESTLTIGGSRYKASGFSISGNTFDNSMTTRFMDAITIIDASNVSISDNIISEFRSGIKVSPQVSFSSNMIQVVGNTISNCSSSLSIQGTNSNKVTSLLVEGNTFSCPDRDTTITNANILASYVNGLVVRSNTMSSGATNIRLVGCINVKIDGGNSILNNSVNALPLFIGGCQYVDVINNSIVKHNTGYILLTADRSSSGAVPQTCVYKNKAINFINNEVEFYDLCLQYRNVTGGRVSGNTFNCLGTLTVSKFVYFSGDSQAIIQGNLCKSSDLGTEVYRKDDTSVVVDPLTLDINTVTNKPVSNVSEPIIVASDASLGNSTSYTINFSLTHYSQMNAKIDRVLRPVSEWVSTLSETPKFAINCQSFNSNKTPDAVLGGVVHDYGGSNEFFYLPSLVQFDRYMSLSCKNWHSSLNYGGVNPSQNILNSAVSEGAWFTCAFRPPLVVDGVLYDAVGLTGLDEASYSSQVSARTSIGQKPDGSFVVLVVDGKSNVSGCTMKQVAEKMLSLGCVQAFNLDGGGSSTLWYNGSILNKPSDEGGERSVAGCLYVV